MEDNYQHRQDLVSPVPEFKGEPKEEQPKKYPGVGPKTREGNYSTFTKGFKSQQILVWMHRTANRTAFYDPRRKPTRMV